MRPSSRNSPRLLSVRARFGAAPPTRGLEGPRVWGGREAGSVLGVVLRAIRLGEFSMVCVSVAIPTVWLRGGAEPVNFSVYGG